MKNYALIGISPFNTKFTLEYLEFILKWAQRNYYHFDFIHPRECSQYLLTSTGTKLSLAKKKSRNEFNRIDNILSEFNVTLNSFDNFINEDKYLHLYEEGVKFFKNNSFFSNLCRMESKKAMLSRIKAKDSSILEEDINIEQQDIDVAVEYILKEIPFLIDPVYIMYDDSYEFDSVDVCYHKNWSIFDYLYNQQSSILLKSHFQQIK